MKHTYTDHRHTTAYHTQTNGLTERLNKTIADIIFMYVNDDHRTWDEVYNTATQETTLAASIQGPSGRIARWSLKLQESHVATMYKYRKRHTDADCLSRPPVGRNTGDSEEDKACL